MKQILVFILALISFSPVLADTPLSEAEFTQLYITTVKKISPKTSANIKGPLEIEFTAEDKTKSITFLGIAMALGQFDHCPTVCTGKPFTKTTSLTVIGTPPPFCTFFRSG